MITKVMLTMGSRIHGDMYVRFGSRLAETYHCKVAKHRWPSLLKKNADACEITKKLTTHTARHSNLLFRLKTSKLQRFFCNR